MDIKENWEVENGGFLRDGECSVWEVWFFRTGWDGLERKSDRDKEETKNQKVRRGKLVNKNETSQESSPRKKPFPSDSHSPLCGRFCSGCAGEKQDLVDHITYTYPISPYGALRGPTGEKVVEICFPWVLALWRTAPVAMGTKPGSVCFRSYTLTPAHAGDILRI